MSIAARGGPQNDLLHQIVGRGIQLVESASCGAATIALGPNPYPPDSEQDLQDLSTNNGCRVTKCSRILLNVAPSRQCLVAVINSGPIFATRFRRTDLSDATPDSGSIAYSISLVEAPYRRRLSRGYIKILSDSIALPISLPRLIKGGVSEYGSAHTVLAGLTVLHVSAVRLHVRQFMTVQSMQDKAYKVLYAQETAAGFCRWCFSLITHDAPFAIDRGLHFLHKSDQYLEDILQYTHMAEHDHIKHSSRCRLHFLRYVKIGYRTVRAA